MLINIKDMTSCDTFEFLVPGDVVIHPVTGVLYLVAHGVISDSKCLVSLVTGFVFSGYEIDTVFKRARNAVLSLEV